MHHGSAHISDLGPVICRARPLPGYQTAKLQFGRSAWLMYFLAVPLFGAPFIAFMGAGGIAAGAKCVFGLADGSLAIIATFLASFAAVYVLGLWHVYFCPRRNLVILCQHGLHIRVGLKRCSLGFEQMEHLDVGRAFSRFENGLLAISQVADPGQAALARHLATTALTISLAGGKKLTFKVFFTQFEPHDIAVLLTRLMKLQPRMGTAR